MKTFVLIPRNQKTEFPVPTKAAEVLENREKALQILRKPVPIGRSKIIHPLKISVKNSKISLITAIHTNVRLSVAEVF